MTTEQTEIQNNEQLHQLYIQGYEDGLMYNRGIGHDEDSEEYWKESCKSAYYLRGLIEAIGFDPRVRS